MYLNVWFEDIAKIEQALVCCVTMKNLRYTNSQLELIEP